MDIYGQKQQKLFTNREKGKDDHIKLVKAIGIVEIFGKQFGIRATNELIENILEANTSIKKLLKDLEEWSIIVYRKHINAWGLFAGSDINLEELIEISTSQIAQTNNLILQNIPPQNPIVAKQHYHKTGTLRWFEIFFVFSNDLVILSKCNLQKFNLVN